MRLSSRWRERTACSRGKRTDACSLWKRADDLLSTEESRRPGSPSGSQGEALWLPAGGRGEGLFIGFFTCGSLAVWWRRRCEVGIRKPGHRLSRPPLFVLPNSSSNQPSNFALRILVGEMSPRGIADLLIYNENGNRPQRIRGQSQCHSGLRTLALRSLFSCASLCTHRIRERRL